MKEQEESQAKKLRFTHFGLLFAQLGIHTNDQNGNGQAGPPSPGHNVIFLKMFLVESVKSFIGHMQARIAMISII